MSLCPYCGKPAGILKRYHEDCRDKYLRAKEQIPQLFEKLQHSSIASSRFVELLVTAARSAGVPREDLKVLAVDGVLRFINAILERRLLTSTDEERVLNILDALKIPLDSSVSLDSLFLKTQILREMSEGQVSDRILVEDMTPLKLRGAEIIVWVFNKTIGYAHEYSNEAETRRGSIADYYSIEWFSRKAEEPRGERERVYKGDIVLTNYNIHVLDETMTQTRVPIARLAEISPYVNAVSFAFGAKRRRVTCFVNDPWFLTNAAALLHRNLIVGRAAIENDT